MIKNRVVRILTYTTVALVSLVLLLWLLIQLPAVQNRLVDYATKRASTLLKTEVKIGSVDFSLFNKFSLNQVLVRDQKKDSLLYAGSIKLKITDWFFIKDNIRVQGLVIEDLLIQTQRTDSIWNYRFIEKALSGGSNKNSNKQRFPFIDAATIGIKRFTYKTKDAWRGEDQQIEIGELKLESRKIDLIKKSIDLENVSIENQRFSIRQYKGNRPDSLRPKPEPRIAGQLYWNPDQWNILAKSILIKNGFFSSDVDTQREAYPYFDGAHLAFDQINGEIKNFEFVKDTLKADINLSTKERSGFEVNSLTASMHMDPDQMSFDQLKITTPYSVLGDYFSMEYEYFSEDMAKFISNVRMKGLISKSKIDLRDIAFFAPQLKNLEYAFDVDAEVNGPVENLTAEKMRVYFGSNSVLDGSLSINGLPDVSNTTYELKNSLLVSNAKDLYALIPELKKNLGFDLNPLGNFNFKGNALATESNLKIEGSAGTALGSISTIANLKNLTSTSIEYGLEGKINSFEFGKLLTLSGLGKTSGTYSVSGKGKGVISFNAKLDSLYFNEYRYTNLNARGGLSKKILESTFEVDDENLLASLMAKIDFNDSLPRSLIDAQVHLADLQQMKLIKLPLQFSGKTKIDIVGNNPDNISGTAKLNDFTVFRDSKPYVFDSLLFSSQRDSSYRVLTLLGKDIDGRLEGDFDFAELPATLNQYFSNYYPLYFTKKDPPKREQNLEFSLELKNATPFLKILDNGMSRLDYSKIEGSIDTRNRIFRLDANIPRFTYNKISIDDFLLNAYGDIDSLKVFSKASSFIINDSLFFPNNEIQIQSSKNLSYVNINTSSTYSDYGAKLSASVRNIEDGIVIHFNPSSLVFNEKTWNIDEDGELLISKRRFDAENILLKNGDQRISLVTLPAEANQAQTIILSLTKVNLGELLPFFLKEPKIQGITTGDLTIEDPYNNLRLYLNAQTDQTRFEEDSIGLTSINAYWDDKQKRSSFFLESDNPNYQFDIKGALNLKDSTNEMIETNFNLVDVNLSILEPYLGVVFSKIEGKGNGMLKITGNVRKPDLIGKVNVRDTKLTIGYSQCTYTLGEHELNFLPGKIDLGNMSISDGLGNTAIVKGTLEHSFFRKFKYDISASSRKLLVMNTSRTDNDLFYGKAIARFNFSLTGPESQMLMRVSGAPVDSSVMNILTETSSKQAADVDYIVWKTYGKEAKEVLDETSNNLIIDLDLTATPLLKMNVVLDELTGDIISGLGTGNLKIRTGTTENLTMIGRYNIESGSYNFNFQDIFKKPFRLLGGGSSYISWTGDPYNAEININALYLAEKVRMSTLFTDPSNSSVSAGVSSDLLREISDVEVRCNLSGTLNNPNPTFQIVIPQNSTVKNNSTIDSRIKAINRDPLEVSKQSTYLIVFKSFAPQAAIVANDLNNELINTTISGVINGILASSVQNFFSKMLGSTVDVNFNYSRTQTNIGGVNNTSQQNNFRENVSLQFIKSYLNDNLIITFGSDFNFAAAGNRTLSAGSQSFLFLPDVNVEYKITPDGKFRTSFFYRSSFDVLSTSGKRDRTGGNVSFRTEFDILFGRRKKPITKEQ